MMIRTLLACACALPVLIACGGGGEDVSDEAGTRAASDAGGIEAPQRLSDGLSSDDTSAALSAFSREIIPLTARGNEPGWALEIGEETLSFQYDYGEQSLTADSYDMREMQGGARITVPDTDLRVMVSDERCITAADMPHPYTVEVRLNARSFTGCGGDTRTLLTGEAWTVTAINGEPVSEGETPPTLGFAQAEIGGSTGCNTYAAAYALTGETLDISPGRSTRMACAGDLMAREAQFLAALDGVNRLSFEGEGGLILTGEVHRIDATREQ